MQEGADTLLFTLSTTDCMPYMEYHPHPPSDTFLHVLCDKEIRFFGRKNRVWGGDLSLSGYRFERLEVPNSQCSTAKQTIWDCKIDLLTSQD